MIQFEKWWNTEAIGKWKPENKEACRDTWKAAQAAAVPSVWVVGTKTFSLVFSTREDANQWQKHNGMDTPASYVVPIEIPVLAFAAPKPEDV